MKQISLKTSCKRLLADVFTPVGIYLRLRDRFRDTVLLESTDHHVSDNSYSFIGINAIAGMEIRDTAVLEYKLPGEHPVKLPLDNKMSVPETIWSFMQRFEIEPGTTREAKYAQGFYGYSTFDAVQFFESIKFRDRHKAGEKPGVAIPLMRYRLYQYVIVINHYKGELFICENIVAGVDSEIQ